MSLLANTDIVEIHRVSVTQTVEEFHFDTHDDYIVMIVTILYIIMHV
jgi:hypothetical protein